jgi:hypothetical protein
MTDSVFEPRLPGVDEPPALRRQRVASRPGGHAALAVRDTLMKRQNARQIKQFERSDIGQQSQRILDTLHDSQSGQTGFIVCNGPSLNKTNLALVEGHPYLLMNRGYLLADRLPGLPAALCVSADLVLEQYGSQIAAIEAPLLLAAHHQATIERRADVAFVEKQREWLFASRIGSSLHMGYTVTFWALQMAFHLGWDKCIIIGMDHRYDQTGDPTVAVRTKGADANHFDPNYFQHGASWLLPDLAMNEYSYQLARAAYEAHGREVVDCSVDGACRVFRRSTVEDELA